MDVPRQKKSRPPWIYWLAGAAALLLTTAGIATLKPAAPNVEASTLWIDEVKHGDMVREVRGNGSLVPEDQRIVSAMTAGRVERVLVRPGEKVTAPTLLLELSNPDVQLQALNAERQLQLAQADLASLKASLTTEKLAVGSAVAAARTELREAERSIAVAETLNVQGLGSPMDTERARDRAEEARERYASEKERFKVTSEALDSQLLLRAAEVERLRDIARFERERVSSMRVTAGAAGVVQELSLQPGAWVNPGQTLARVAGQEKLKAVVRVPEALARDLALGLKAQIDTHNGIIEGRVMRIDPAVLGGTVAVDLSLEGTQPRGVRPDLSVDAVIEIERLVDVTYVGRPAEASSEGVARLFRLDRDGRAAQRVSVRLGRGSATTVEVLEGLASGDRVILSDMTQWATAERVRLH